VQELVTRLIRSVPVSLPVFRADVDVAALYRTHAGGPFKNRAAQVAASNKIDQLLAACILRREPHALSVENFGSMAYGLGTVNSVRF
jgi:hypothetical protein